MNEKDPKNSILPIAALKRGLLHSCSDVRKLCARILEKISNREALENLCTLAYQDPDPRVSQYAKVAIRSIVNQRMVSA